RRAGRSRPEAAVRHRGCTSQRLRRLRHGYAVQRLRPYGPYGPYEGRNEAATARLRRTAATAVRAVRAVRRKERRVGQGA
ncbi:hypothetical protein L249_4235, partial [Ophiocordyceps polyrhachis-furcata BCC 54312]